MLGGENYNVDFNLLSKDDFYSLLHVFFSVLRRKLYATKTIRKKCVPMMIILVGLLGTAEISSVCYCYRSQESIKI